MFVVLEGIDGSGKSEQAGRLAGRLRGLGHEVVQTREPTDGRWGRRYRAWARGEHEASSDEVLEYFLRDRHEHVENVIQPALRRSAWVVCDRYVASTLAYQAAQGVDREALRQRVEAQKFPVPDLTLWLRLPVEVALARLAERGRERFEQREFLERVDREYRAFGMREIDADQPPDAVEDLLLESVLRSAKT